VILGAWVEGLVPDERSVVPEDDAVELILSEGGAIRGHVYWMDGSSLGDDALVTCWEAGLAPSGLFADDTSIPTWRIVPTASDGSFVVTGLDPGQRYTVSAVGPWSVAAQPAVGVAPEGPPLTIRISPLYGLDIVVSGPDGAPLSVDPGIGANSLGFDRHAGRGVSIDRPDVGLLGLQREDLAPGRRRRTLLHAAEYHAESIGPFTVSFSLPGYADASTVVMLPRVTSSSLVTHRLELTRSAEAFGTLRVALEGVSDPGRPLTVSRYTGFIRRDTVKSCVRGSDQAAASCLMPSWKTVPWMTSARS